jgi:hypothetical protein
MWIVPAGCAAIRKTFELFANVSVIGHSPELYLPEFGVTEAKWQEEFGNTFRIKGSLGVSQSPLDFRSFCFYPFAGESTFHRRSQGSPARFTNLHIRI